MGIAWAWAPTPFVEARGKFVTGEESFVYGTGSMRRRGRSFSLSNGKKQAHPFIPHRETGQSDAQKCAN